MTEAEMQLFCYNKLKSLDEYKNVVLEVPFLSRCIDMVLVTGDDKIISIEFKLNKWRDAIEQARDHKLGADLAYICLPKKKRLTDKLRKELVDNGIGLYFYNPELSNPLEVAIPAEYSEVRWDPIINNLKNTINKIAITEQ